MKKVMHLVCLRRIIFTNEEIKIIQVEQMHYAPRNKQIKKKLNFIVKFETVFIFEFLWTVG